MTTLRMIPSRPKRDLIDAAIETHGAARVLMAAVKALMRPKPRPPDIAALSPHMRRDIGLPHLGEPMLSVPPGPSPFDVTPTSRTLPRL